MVGRVPWWTQAGMVSDMFRGFSRGFLRVARPCLTGFLVIILLSKRVLRGWIAWFCDGLWRGLGRTWRRWCSARWGTGRGGGSLRWWRPGGEGVLYSDILHGLGLNTGKLNYHLKLLDGVVEKDDSRRYRLTDLGVRAMGLLGGLTEDLDEESVRRFSSVRERRDEFVVGVVGWYFNLIIVGTFTFFLGVVSLFWLGMGRTFDPVVVYGVIGVSALCFVGLTWWLLRVRRDAPERIVGFLQRMGLYRHRG
ncbi:hypothetical protein ES703_25950 [subsurface metagenome]